MSRAETRCSSRGLAARAVRRWLAAACFLAATGAAGSARAESAEPAEEPPSDARRAEAKARYEEGARAYDEQRYNDAVDKFLEADELVSSAPLSFNIARAYEKLGDGSGALQWYRDYLRRAPDAANAAAVQEAIEALEDKLAAKGLQQLTIRTVPRGATVLVDDQPVGVTPWTGDFPPGAHRVTLSLKGYTERTQGIELEANDALDLEVALTKAPAAAPVPQQVGPERSPRPVRDRAPLALGPWPYVTLAAGGAALSGALVFEMLRRGAEDDARDDPTQIGYSESYDRMQSHQTKARVLAGVGGALAVAGGVLLVIDLGAKKPTRPSTALQWGCNGVSCGVGARGRF